MSDVNSMLWRQIEPGTEFDHLLPKTFCQPTYVGEGLTDFSIDAMEDNILEYNWQTEKLADVLQRQTLNSTALAIHEFLYKHIQYHADKNDQLLRSPACSWYTRKEGIDCKSYSIFASCLLLNMGITHYIRKIKQPSYAPDEYTHVYVIVPTDQTNGSLNKGYYVIDGTIKENKEPAFIGESNLKMEGMKHYSLNGINQNGLNGGISLSGLKDLSKQISIKNIKSVFAGIDCIGGSAFTEAMSKTSLANIDKYFQEWSVKFNTAIQQDNIQLLSSLAAEFKGNSTVFLAASQKKVTQGYNSCTTKRINANITAFKFYKEVVGSVLDAYLTEYFNKISGTFSQNANYTSENSEAIYGFSFTNVSPHALNTQPKQLYSPNISKNIPAFTLPQYVIDQANSGQSINLDTVLNLLETAGNVIKTVAPGSGGGIIKTPIKDGAIITPIPTKTNTMSMGSIAGWGIALFSLGFIFKNMKDTGPGAKATRTPRTTTKKTK